MKRTSSFKPFFSLTTLIKDFSFPSVNRQLKKNIKKVAQKPQYHRNQLVDYMRFNKLMVVTDISFHQHLKTYLYTLAVEDFEGLESLCLNLVLGSVPILAMLTVTASSSIAATFASSSTNIFLSEFSSVSTNVGIVATPDLFLNSNDGSVDGSVDFNPIFIENNPVASDSSVAFVEGEGQNYVGTAKTDVSLIGNSFFVEAGSIFSFDFLAELELETFIDNPGSENAIAEGNISFFLFNNESDTLLDFFSISAQIETDEPGDLLSVQSSSNFTLRLDDSDREFGGNEEFIEAVYIGGFSREFSEDTSLRLVADTTNYASVATAPEPSGGVAVLILGAVGIAMRKLKSDLFRQGVDIKPSRRYS